jgi:hypothetical protein
LAISSQDGGKRELIIQMDCGNEICDLEVRSPAAIPLGDRFGDPALAIRFGDPALEKTFESLDRGLCGTGTNLATILHIHDSSAFYCI